MSKTIYLYLKTQSVLIPSYTRWHGESCKLKKQIQELSK